MAINVGNLVVKKNAVVTTPQHSKQVGFKSTVKKINRVEDIEVEDRLKDPKHLKLHEIDEDKKVSQYMLDMYNSNELISFDK